MGDGQEPALAAAFWLVSMLEEVDEEDVEAA
jgi:hypothetical protein